MIVFLQSPHTRVSTFCFFTSLFHQVAHLQFPLFHTDSLIAACYFNSCYEKIFWHLMSWNIKTLLSVIFNLTMAIHSTSTPFSFICFNNSLSFHIFTHVERRHNFCFSLLCSTDSRTIFNLVALNISFDKTPVYQISQACFWDIPILAASLFSVDFSSTRVFFSLLGVPKRPDSFLLTQIGRVALLVPS
jgi:hypothetical protein